MPAGHNPLAVFLLVTLLLLAASAGPYTHGGGGGRMVIVRAPGTTTTTIAAVSSRYNGRRLVEDGVAPEFAGLRLGADDDDFVSSGALIDDKAVCIHNCGGKGKPYVRPCANIYLSQGC